MAPSFQFKQEMKSTTFIALLRGINVGGHHKIRMEDLRSLCTDLDWTGVQTYIQSGNLVFNAEATSERVEKEMEHAIERRFGLNIPVIVRPGTAWPAYVRSNPFPESTFSEANRVMLVLSKAPPKHDAVQRLQERAAGSERIVQFEDALWIHYADGAGKSRLSPALLDRFIGSPSTMRNVRTVVKIEELVRLIQQ